MQASIVIITTAAGKMQDDTANDSLDPAVSLWLAYAVISVVISSALLLVSYTSILPAARLAQVPPRHLVEELQRLATLNGLEKPDLPTSHKKRSVYDSDIKEQERILKSTDLQSKGKWGWTFLAISVAIIILGWVLFGFGVAWGVHGSVIAGTTGE